MSDPNIYRGIVRPYVPRTQTPSLWEHVLFIGQSADNKFFSRIVARLKPATLQFPNPGLFLQLGTGAGSALVRISYDELVEIRDAFIRWCEEVKPKIDAAEEAAKLLKEQRDKFEQARAMIQAMQEAQENEPNSDAYTSGSETGLDDTLPIVQDPEQTRRRNGRRIPR